MWTCALLLVLTVHAHAITRDQFYPYGPELQDSTLPSGAEVSSPEIPLRVPILFYGETYESIFVNNYGVVSFRENIPAFLNSEFPLPYPSIAAFYSNIDTSESGAIYYRETDNPDVIKKAQKSVQIEFSDYDDFVPTSVFLATWLDVTYQGNQPNNKRNTFQIAIISNGTESFVELLYPENQIQWIQKELSPGQMPDAKAQAGFIAENGRTYTLKGSGSYLVRNIMSWSNVHDPGRYVYRVGQVDGPNGNIVNPDIYNSDGSEEDDYKTCALSAPGICHEQASCVDYSIGLCCRCNEGFYGNGKSCIKDDVPLRVHGKLNGIINGVSLNDVDIQAYVVVVDGRSYTALSQVPGNLGGSLQLLNVLGGVISWLFAKPQGNAKNGYQLTGSTFNHTAEVFFPTTGDRVSIIQEYTGHDVFDQITLYADVRGTLPIIESGDKVEASEFSEDFTLVETGTIRSESSRTLIVKRTGQQIVQRVTQTINYTPCRNAPPTEDMQEPFTMKSSKNYLGHEIRENIIRYGTSTKVSPLGADDPCVRGKETCSSKSTCVVKGNTFECICEPGFTNYYEGDKAICVDIDECAVGTHNCDTMADCFNHEGGFSCQCRQGFEGDGVRCTALPQCTRYDEYGRCVTEPDSSLPTGVTCDVLRNCHPYAECVPTADGSYMCRCGPGFTGDGYYCAEEYKNPTDTNTNTNTNTNENEFNETIVLPNCDYYGDCICPSRYTRFTDESGNYLCQLVTQEYTPIPPQVNNSTAIRCDADFDCPPNAVCQNNECVCQEGYESDGYECLERSGAGSTCVCGHKARCIDSTLGEPVCVCDPGYHGDGYTCRPNFSCTNDTDCEYNAECRLDAATREYICQCSDGFVKDENDACIPDRTLCNGAVCAEHASCLYDQMIGVNYCHCDQGYDGEAIVKCIPQRVTCEVTNDCHPDAICTKNDYTFECVCREGFIGDGYICAPEPSCRNDPYMCDVHASCLKHKEGYICECNVGYNGNGSSCVLNPRQSGSFLIASDGFVIYKAPFEPTVTNNAVPINTGSNQLAIGISVDCQTGTVYWGDIGNDATIKRASYDGSNYEVFLGNVSTYPEGIAIDGAARNVFWTDAKKHSIEVANMDTKVKKVLFMYEGIVNPRGIAVHPQKGKVFWSDWNRERPKIEWANMDGSERAIFHEGPDLKLPNALAIDWATDRLCYTNAEKNTIECIGIDTKRREIITKECKYPFGLTINDGTFYWTDWKSTKVEFIDTNTNTRGQVQIATGARKLYGVAVVTQNCNGYANICQYRQGNCGYGDLCLPNGQGGRTCVPGD